MLFTIIYCGTGIYLLLILKGWIHKDFQTKLDQPRRTGIIAMSVGLIVLGLYYAFHSYFFSTPAGKDYKRLQEDMNREYLRNRTP